MENDKVTTEEISQAMELFPTLWVEKYGIKNESGMPIEFDNRRFMYDIYNDMSPYQVILKPPQIGATVMMVVKTFYVANKLKKDIIYTLPTASDVNDMAGGKVNRIVAQNPILKEWVKGHDTVEQKSIGDNIIYYRGTFSAKQAMMVSSDLNIHDEVDASDPQVITQYETRLQAKAGGWRWYFSHPSLASFGVDIYWQQSDKKEWYITCSHCNSRQILKFPDNIDILAKTKICSSCKEVLPDEDIKYGEWQATDKGEFSGYHISQLMCTWITAEKIIKDYNEKSAQYFANMVLGLPYVGSDAKVVEEDIYKNIINKVNTQEGQIIIGVDTGLPIYYTIMNKDGFFFHGECKDYDHLEKLMIRYPNAVMVSDQGGDLIGIRALQEKFPNRVFLCYYRKDRKSQELVKWGTGENTGIVVVDRNRMIQFIVDQLKDGGRINFFGSKEDWKPVAQHFNNIYRVTKETTYGTEYVWERNGPDHKVHTILYALVGFDRFALTEAQIIGSDDFLSGIKEGRIFYEE